MAFTQTIEGGKDRAFAVSALWLNAQEMLKAVWLKKEAKVERRSAKMVQTVRKISGSQCTINAAGLITALRDAEGRTWEFEYDGERLVSFCNPFGEHWRLHDNFWMNDCGARESALHVVVDHASADVFLTEGTRRTHYRADGTTVVTVCESRDGDLKQVTYTELATRPRRAFVVLERTGFSDRVTWIQDCNGKLFKLEYEGDRLVAYYELSQRPAVVWRASYDEAGNIAQWQGYLRREGTPVGVMEPSLLAVDASGNRYFKRRDGYEFTLAPSGAASAEMPAAVQAGAWETALRLQHYRPTC